MVIIVVMLIINMNNYIKKVFIEKSFVLNQKIVVLDNIAHLLILKKTLNVN